MEFAKTTMPGLFVYITEGTEFNTDLNNRVACLLSEKGQGKTKVNEIDSNSAEIIKISEVIGEIFENH